MTKEAMEKLQQMDAANDEGLQHAIETLKTPEEMINYLKERGVEVTKEDLFPEQDSLTEENLESVAGGVQIFGFGLGFFGGYCDALEGKEAKSGGLLYQLGSWAGRTILWR
jgi:predicted ribosomally synthesized peptide with nif11-like leader